MNYTKATFSACTCIISMLVSGLYHNAFPLEREVFSCCKKQFFMCIKLNASLATSLDLILIQYIISILMHDVYVCVYVNEAYESQVPSAVFMLVFLISPLQFLSTIQSISLSHF